MKKGKQVLYVFITVISIAIIGIFIGKDMTATDDKIIQVMFENENITEESIDIHVTAQCLDDYEIKAMQVDDQLKVDNVTEVDFTATENRDYIVKVYYQSLTRQEELIETFTTTVDSIEEENNNISMLAETTNVTPLPDIVTTPDGYTFDKSTGKIQKYTQQPGITQLTIPNEIEGITVKIIGENAFSHNTTLTQVIIPQSVESIESDAFYSCSNITSLQIPSSIKSVGDRAFSDLDITSITIPKTLNKRGKSLFKSCDQLRDVVIESGIDTINYGEFYMCYALKNIVIPDTVTSIGDFSFYFCESLEEIKIPESVKSIGKSVFTSCHKLTKVNIPEGVTTLEENAFMHCYIIEEITIPNSVVSIGKHCFYHCPLLTKIRISHSLIEIGDSAFEQCESLTDLEIPHTVNRIGARAFYGTKKLKNLIIPPLETYESQSVPKSQLFGTSLEKITIPMGWAKFGHPHFLPQQILIMCTDPLEVDVPDDAKILSETVLQKDIYRGILTGDIRLEQQKIYSMKTQGRNINLRNIFDYKGVKEVIYKGLKGTEVYVGNDIEIPKDYLKLEEGTDISMKYQIVGTPSSPNTKIIGDKLYIAADETASDLKVTANVLSTTKEVPITIVPIDSIAIKNGPQNTYTDGEIYNPKGLIITVTYKDGYQEDIVYSDENKSDFTFKYEKLDLTTPKQIITYKGFSIEQNLTIQNRYIDKVLIHDDLKIEVKGKFTENSYIIVEKRKEIDTEFYKKLDDKKVIGNYEVRVIGEYKDDLFIVFDVGEKYNHKKAYIRHLKQNGSIETYEKIILNGKVGITVNELSPFVIYIESDIYHDLNNDIHDQSSSQINNLPNIDVEENKSRQSVITLTDDNTNMIGYILLAGMSLLLMRIRKKRSKI